MFKHFQNIPTFLFFCIFAIFIHLPLTAQVTHTVPAATPKKQSVDTSNTRYGDGKHTTSSIKAAGSQQPEPATPVDTAKFDYGGGIDLNIPESDEDSGMGMPDVTPQNGEETQPANSPGNISAKETAPAQPIHLNDQGKSAATMPAAATPVKVYETYKRDVIKENKLLRSPAVFSYPFDTNKIPEYTDAEYAARLKSLPTVIPMEYNELVGKFIKMYVVLKRDQLTRMLPRTDHYFRIFEETLDRYGLPMELKYLPVMESALIPHAKSDNGAGLWQLPYGTARMYGLEANSFIDERFDPVLSTEAAVQHLRNLYSKYRDWQTVIAAFNCGEGTVNKAIRIAGGKKKYSEIASFLPDEAQSYVPLYTAAVYAMNYYPEHNLVKHDAPYNFYATDTVRVRIPIDLKEVATYIGMPLEELQFLNPAVKRNVVPRMPNGFPITLPVSKIDDFGSFLAGKSAAKTEIIINNGNIEQRVKLPESSVWNYEMDVYGLDYAPVKIDEGPTITVKYTVRDGDVLGVIAENYDCTTDELKRWNRLPNNNLKTGQVLLIRVPKAYEKVYKNIEARFEEEDAQPTTEVGSTQNAANPNVIVAQYIFKEDDSLAKIAQSFNITTERLMKFNNLKVDIVMPGTVLKIPAPEQK